MSWQSRVSLFYLLNYSGTNYYTFFMPYLVQDFLGGAPTPKEASHASLARMATKNSAATVASASIKASSPFEVYDEEGDLERAIAMSLKDGKESKEEEKQLDSISSIAVSSLSNSSSIPKEKLFVGFTPEVRIS